MYTTFIPAEMPSANLLHLQAVAGSGWLASPRVLRFMTALGYQLNFFASGDR